MRLALVALLDGLRIPNGPRALYALLVLELWRRAAG